MTDPATLWTRQQQDAEPPTPAVLVAAEARLRRRLWRRDAIEYAAGLVGLAVFGWIVAIVPDWGVRAGFAGIGVGMLVLLFNLWRRRSRTPDAFEAASLDYYRAQLAKQRDILASVWRWYLAPLVPDMVLLLLAIAHAASRHMPLWAAALSVGIGALPVAGVFWGIHRMNQLAARRLQQRIDALDRGEIA